MNGSESYPGENNFVRTSAEPVTDLGYLKEITGGEPEVMKELIGLFLSQIPEFKKELQLYLKNQDWVNLGKAAHHAKSSVMTFGLRDLGLTLKQLQLKTQQLGGSANYQPDVDEFVRVITIAEAELRQELEKL